MSPCLIIILLLTTLSYKNENAKLQKELAKQRIFNLSDLQMKKPDMLTRTTEGTSNAPTSNRLIYKPSEADTSAGMGIGSAVEPQPEPQVKSQSRTAVAAGDLRFAVQPQNRCPSLYVGPRSDRIHNYIDNNNHN